MIDKNYIKELARHAYFELDDKQATKIAEEIPSIDHKIQNLLDLKLEPNAKQAFRCRVKNYATLREDIPTSSEVDALNSADTIINNFVVIK